MDDASFQAPFNPTSLRSRAAAFRKLADEYEYADPPIAAKLREVAAELEAKANGAEPP
jgi:hypothetical protein